MTTLQLLQDDLLEKTNDVEEFIASLDDSRMRRIINFRFWKINHGCRQHMHLAVKPQQIA